MEGTLHYVLNANLEQLTPKGEYQSDTIVNTVQSQHYRTVSVRQSDVRSVLTLYVVSSVFCFASLAEVLSQRRTLPTLLLIKDVFVRV